MCTVIMSNFGLNFRILAVDAHGQHVKTNGSAPVSACEREYIYPTCFEVDKFVQMEVQILYMNLLHSSLIGL